MVEIDYTIPEILISYEGDLDLKEFYYLVRNWLRDQGFYVLEKEHEGKEDYIKSKWEANRKADEYARYIIKVTLIANNIKQISIKNKNLCNGEFSVKFESYVESDYENRWEKKPLLKLFRSIYGRYVDKARDENYHRELKDMTIAFYNEIKGYLGLKSRS